MKVLPIATFAAGLLMAVAAAQASNADARPQSQQNSTPAPAVAVAAKDKDKADDPNRRVCKYVVQTGSRMGRKICHTQAYWEEMELAARDKMREIDSQAIQQKSN